jgi:hypothetical protein
VGDGQGHSVLELTHVHRPSRPEVEL